MCDGGFEELFILVQNSVSVLCGVIFGRHNKTSSLPGSPVHGLDNVDHLLLVLHGPVDLVVIAGAQIDHDVLVPEEEHDRAGVVQLVHLVEVGHLSDVHKINDSEVLHLFGYGKEGLVHLHASRVPVVAEANHNDLVFLTQDGLVNLSKVIPLV